METNLDIEVPAGCTFFNKDFKYEIFEELTTNVSISLLSLPTINLESQYSSEIIPTGDEIPLISEDDFNYRNVTQQLVKLYSRASGDPERILLPDNEIGLNKMMIIAITILICIRIGCCILRTLIKKP